MTKIRHAVLDVTTDWLKHSQYTTVNAFLEISNSKLGL